jgi:hypothetical protein
MRKILTPVVQPIMGQIYEGPYIRRVLLQDASFGGYDTYKYVRAGGWIRISQGRGNKPSTWQYTGLPA